MKQTILSFSTLCVFAFLFWASNPVVKKLSTTENEYFDTQKKDENITISYKLPHIKPTGKTAQRQEKGGVTISAEVVPFRADRVIKPQKKITYADPTKPDYDILEVSNIPEYEVTPKNISFNVRIRNNEEVPLKLSEIGFAIIIDGVQWSFPTGYLDEWNKGIVLSGFEKEYTIQGPELSGLFSAKVVYLFLNGVPISYNDAGSITKKSNFEWYFECNTEPIIKEDKTTYTYETAIIESRQCAKCSGTGTDPRDFECRKCNGSGLVKNTISKKYYKCPDCGGTGIIHFKCENCIGKGVTYHPKSQEPPVKNSVAWNGWEVKVQTIPAGASIKVIDTKTGEYKAIKEPTPCVVDWYCTGAKDCPIIIEYRGKSVKVLPIDKKGVAKSVVRVDFSKPTPKIIFGIEG